MEDIIRKRIYVDGRVQGVGFRYKVKYLAPGFGITGLVKNLDDGRVEMELQGTDSGIERLLQEINNDRFIVIKDMQWELISVIEEKGFHIR
ncbi:acylphosphatase [Lacrimispora xylanolytica]